MNNLTPRPGAIAIASNGDLGLITSDEPEYSCVEGKTQLAWRGIQLCSVRGGQIGDRWSSRNPTVVGHVEDFGVTTIELADAVSAALNQ